MTEVALNALINFAKLSLFLVGMVGSGLLCMFIADRTIGNPLVGLGVWGLAFMVACSIAQALP